MWFGISIPEYTADSSEMLTGSTATNFIKKKEKKTREKWLGSSLHNKV